ncbi:hypothetical protein KI387_043116, partial [Taxus chinensis]
RERWAFLSPSNFASASPSDTWVSLIGCGSVILQNSADGSTCRNDATLGAGSKGQFSIKYGLSTCP